MERCNGISCVTSTMEEVRISGRCVQRFKYLYAVNAMDIIYMVYKTTTLLHDVSQSLAATGMAFFCSL